MLPLGLLSPGQLAIIKNIPAGRRLSAQLTDMGFVNGSKVRIVQNQTSGPLLVSLGDSRVAIGRGIAQKIMVEEVEQS